MKGVVLRSLRSTGVWASPGGCGWRTRSTTTSTTPSTSSCRRNRCDLVEAWVEALLLRGWRVPESVCPPPTRL